MGRDTDELKREFKQTYLSQHEKDLASREPVPLTGHDVFKGPTSKETNPKDAVGVRKVPLSVVPSGVMAELGLALLEGARKYGRHNYRVAGIRYSVYYDAAMRHLMSWWEGENVDPDSGLSHVTKAIATLTVLRDAMMRDKYTDDRPPKMPEGWVQHMNELAGKIIVKYPDPVAPHTEKPL
jgi:hypothetical protein